MSGHVESRCPQPARDAARAFLEQAEDNYRAAAEAAIVGAKPVLLYYSFLNLAKAYILMMGRQASLDTAHHGIAEQLAPGGRELVDATLPVKPSLLNKLFVFDELMSALTGAGLPAQHAYPVPHLLGQVVSGHRLWAAASGAAERFLAVDGVHMMGSSSSNEAWLAIDILADDMARLNLSEAQLLSAANLGSNWKEIESTNLTLRRFEQTATTSFVPPIESCTRDLVGTLEPNLWTTVLSVPPYRRYYLYALPVQESRLHQLLSVYALIFYLGSVTRYRPHHFDKIIAGPYGPFVREFISTAPGQFIYMMASRFGEREVARPAII